MYMHINKTKKRFFTTKKCIENFNHYQKVQKDVSKILERLIIYDL